MGGTACVPAASLGKFSCQLQITTFFLLPARRAIQSSLLETHCLAEKACEIQSEKIKGCCNEKSTLRFNCKTLCEPKKIVNLSSELEIKLPASEMRITENEFFLFVRETDLQAQEYYEQIIKGICRHRAVCSYKIQETFK